MLRRRVAVGPPRLTALASVLTAVLVLPACSSTATPSADPTTAATSHGGSGPSSGKDAPPVIGIAFGNELFTARPGSVVDQLRAAARAHATWVRIDMSWASLQPRNASSFDWAPLDRVVRQASALHLKVLGIVSYTPPWARAPGCEVFTCPPADPAVFARFAGRVAEHYRDSAVAAYEIWNEPNIPDYWVGPSPAAYGALARRTIPAVHRSAPQAQVILGGLGPNGANGAIEAPTFLREACSSGACDGVDGVGVQPYTFPHSPEQQTSPPNAWARMTQSSPGLPSLTSVMQDVGLGGKPLWITAFGAPTSGTSATAGDGSMASLATQTDHVTEDWQAHIVAQGLDLALADRSDIAGVFVYTLDDTDATVAGSFGLRDAQGRPKPAYAAFREAADHAG